MSNRKQQYAALRRRLHCADTRQRELTERYEALRVELDQCRAEVHRLVRELIDFEKKLQAEAESEGLLHDPVTGRLTPEGLEALHRELTKQTDAGFVQEVAQELAGHCARRSR